jgi:hypothetical protein
MLIPKIVNLNNLDWFLQNFDAISLEYKNQWIAIHENIVIASAETTSELKSQLKEKNIIGAFITNTLKEKWII